MKQNRKERNELLNKLRDKLSEINKDGKGGVVSLNKNSLMKNNGGMEK